MSHEEIAIQLRPYNGEYGRNGGRLGDRTAVATSGEHGFSIWLSGSPVEPQGISAKALWKPSTSGASFTLTIFPSRPRRVVVAEIGGAVAVVAVSSVVEALLGIDFPISIVITVLMLLAYFVVLEPYIPGLMFGEREYRQGVSIKRFVAEVLDAREIAPSVTTN